MPARSHVQLLGCHPVAVLLALLAVAGGAAGTGRRDPSAAGSAADGSESTVVISAFLADGQVPGDADEAVQLWNLGADPVDLDGWSVGDAGGRVVFPPGARLAGRTYWWLGREAAAFARSFGSAPDWSWAGVATPPPRLGLMATSGGGPRLADDGDALFLRRPDGSPADAVAYGRIGPPAAGWLGPPIGPYRGGGLATSHQVLYRKLDGPSGLPIADSDRAADWAADPADALRGRRARYPGWDLEARLRPEQVTGGPTAQVEVAVAPDALAAFLTRHLAAASASIDMEVYTFEQPGLAELVAERARAGLRVRLALEGAPAGGISQQERWCLARMAEAGATVSFMDRGGDIAARYRGLHAKLAVIDGRLALIGSENPGLGSAPADDLADGTAGRRGVWLATDEPGVVRWAQGLLDADLAAGRADLRPFQARDPQRGAPLPDFRPERAGGGGAYQPRFARTLRLALPEAVSWELLSAPENVLDPDAGLPGLLGRAGPGDRVAAEQLDEPLWWGASAGTGPPEEDPAFNPRVRGYLAAARRGAEVRVLLDGFFDDPSHPNSNLDTVEFLMARARAEGLDLEARRGNPSGLGLHNKMVLVSAGCGRTPDETAGPAQPPSAACRRLAHLGSINGSESANKVNREAGLTVASPEIHDYLAAVFAWDWARSGGNALYLPALGGP